MPMRPLRAGDDAPVRQLWHECWVAVQAQLDEGRRERATADEAHVVQLEAALLDTRKAQDLADGYRTSLVSRHRSKPAPSFNPLRFPVGTRLARVHTMLECLRGCIHVCARPSVSMCI